MGTDIHMHLINYKGEMIMENLYEGRNYEWFDNLLYKHNEYEYLSTISGLPTNVPPIIKEDQEYCYGFQHISLADYINWFCKYRPDREAGWVTTYDEWRMKNKGYIPNDIQYRLTVDDIIKDMRFVEFENPYNPDSMVISKLNNFTKSIDINDYIIVFYFDN